MGRVPWVVAIVIATAACSGEDSAEQPRLPLEIQKRLPLEISLGNLCPGAESPPELIRDIRRRAETLLSELAVHPDHLVTYTYFTEEEGPVRTEITVREVAEGALDDLRAGEAFGPCAPDLQERLERALS